MEGYEVISVNDDKCIGHVVGRVGENLIVEHGTLRKHRNPLPLAFAEIDEGQQRVTTTLSHELVYDAPEVNGGEPDFDAIAEHYGLATSGAALTAGYGDVNPEDDPAAGAESDWRRTGTASPVAERAQVRETMTGQGATDAPVEPTYDGYTRVPRSRDKT